MSDTTTVDSTSTENSSQPKALAVGLGTSNLDTCKIEITNFTGQSITVAYYGLPANQPATYENFIAIWRASMIPWTAEPLKKVKIEQNVQNGTITLDDLTISYSSYIVAYGVGPDIGTICASAVLSAGGTRAPSTSVSIGIENLGETSISVHYRTLAGYLPKENGNWVGIWEGYVSPFNLPPTNVGKAIVDDYSNEGIVALNNLTLGRNTTYTLIYFMGTAETTAAATLTFNTSDYQTN